jgi:hypothetical protein
MGPEHKPDESFRILSASQGISLARPIYVIPLNALQGYPFLLPGLAGSGFL